MKKLKGGNASISPKIMSVDRKMILASEELDKPIDGFVNATVDTSESVKSHLRTIVMFHDYLKMYSVEHHSAEDFDRDSLANWIMKLELSLANKCR